MTTAAETVRLHADLAERFTNESFREWVWANLTKLRTLPDDVGWRTVGLFRSHLAVAENFFVTEAMMPVVYGRAMELPDDLPQIAAEPPDGYGFLVFEQPIHITNGLGRQETITAMSWGTGTILDDFHYHGETIPGMHGRVIATWTRVYDEEQRFIEQDIDPDTLAGLERLRGPWHFVMLGGMWDGDLLGPLFPSEEQMAHDSGSPRLQQLLQREGLVPDEAQLETRHRVGNIVAPPGHSVSIHKIIAALWSLCNETIPGSAILDRHQPDRATRRLARRMQHPGDVSIVRLRREEERIGGIETGRTIGVRYHVKGHHRVLKRGTPEERTVWVHEHWRGPEDAPLSLRQTVRTLIR